MTAKELTEGVKALIAAYEQANDCVVLDLETQTKIQRYSSGLIAYKSRSIKLKIEEQ